MLMTAADRLCKGRLVLVHEGGYCETHVPICGLAIMEALSGHSSGVEDPFLDLARNQLPGERFNHLQAEILDHLAADTRDLVPVIA